MEFVLFVNGEEESKQAMKALRVTSISLRVVRPKYADGHLPALMTPAGFTVRGISGIEGLVARLCLKR